MDEETRRRMCETFGIPYLTVEETMDLVRDEYRKDQANAVAAAKAELERRQALEAELKVKEEVAKQRALAKEVAVLASSKAPGFLRKSRNDRIRKNLDEDSKRSSWKRKMDESTWEQSKRMAPVLLAQVSRKTRYPVVSYDPGSSGVSKRLTKQLAHAANVAAVLQDRITRKPPDRKVPLPVPAEDLDIVDRINLRNFVMTYLRDAEVEPPDILNKEPGSLTSGEVNDLRHLLTALVLNPGGLSKK